MGFLFNQGAKAVAQQNVAATGMPIQTSVYGKPISISYGMTRIAPNLIWYAGFTAIPHNNPSAGGGKGGTTGGGGKGGGGNVTYTYEVDIIEALCEGTISGVNNMWVSQTETTPAAQGISIFNGANGQATWSFLTSNFPSQALPYSGVAYAAAGPFNLDKNSSLPNINYEVKGIYYGTAPNGIDADASLVLNDLLTNTTYGVGIATNRVGTLVQNDEAQTIPSSPGPYTVTVTNASSFQWNLDVVDSSGIYTCVASNPGARQYSFNSSTGVYTFNSANAGTAITIRYVSLSGLTDYQNFTLASGLWISPCYDTQTPASSIVSDIGKSTYASPVWSSGVLTMVPRSTVNVTGNGHSFTAPVAPKFDLSDDDFMENTGGTTGNSTDPVIITRKRQADQNNTIKLEYLDRSNQYAPSIAEITDQALVDKFGRRAAASQTTHQFCDINAAHISAQLQLQDEYIRNVYSFTLLPIYAVLDPMDIVTITDSALGLSKQWVRITEITENDDGSLAVTAEEYPSGTGASGTYSLNQGQGYSPNFNQSPGFINSPIIFEPPVQISTTAGLQLWCAISGANQTVWGGCRVWASSDGNTYKLVGNQIGPARMGVTTADFPTGSDPDTTDTLAVDLTQSAGSLSAGTQNDADQNHTLCIVKSTNGIELVSYEQATLTAANKYNLGATGGNPGYLRRGQYGTSILHAPSGSSFARLDDLIFIVPYDKSQIGQTIYLKFPSFNVWEGGQQALSDVPAYTYTIQGPPLPPNVTGFSVKQNGGAVVFRWDHVSDYALKGYDILYGPQGAGIASATILTEAGAGTEMTNSAVQPGTWTFYIRARDIADQLSPSPSSFNFTVTNENPVIIDDFEAPSWLGTPSGYLEHWTGVLVPDSTKAANLHTNAQLFEQYVPFPVATSTYKSNALDQGFNSTLRVFANITANLGRSQTGTVSPGFSIDTWLDGQTDPNTFTSWTIGTVDFRFLRGEVTVNNVAGSVAYLSQFEIVADQTAAIVDSGNQVVAAGGTAISFTQKFHAPPNVQVTPVGNTALIASAANITNTGCTLHVYNTSGTDVGGTVSWAATGD